jgi:hypothetical protein
LAVVMARYITAMRLCAIDSRFRWTTAAAEVSTLLAV